MARQPRVTNIIYVIDTSYLLELFQVPTFSDTRGIEEVTNRIRAATSRRAILVVPIPCLFELIDHIHDISDGTVRRRLAGQVLESVRKSVEKQKPWLLTPSPGEDFPSFFLSACESFAKEYAAQGIGLTGFGTCCALVYSHAAQGIGLTDCYAVLEAKRLREKYPADAYKVHIWTKDKKLKAREPDSEENPFVV